MTDNTELLPCPFCGGEAEICHVRDICQDPQDWYWGKCPTCYMSGKTYPTEAEAIAAWNTRADYHGYEQAAIEAWKSIKTWNTRATHGTLTAEQVRMAIFNGSSYASYDGAQYYANGIIMQAIADELNARAERTCGFVSSNGPDCPPVCSACGYELGIYDCEWYEDGTYGYDGNYCPNCGAKVVTA